MRRLLCVLCAVVLSLAVGVIAASAAGTSGWMGCSSLSGTAKLTLGLPQAGHTNLVTPIVSIKDATLSGCRGLVKAGNGVRSLRFTRRRTAPR